MVHSEPVHFVSQGGTACIKWIFKIAAGEKKGLYECIIFFKSPDDPAIPLAKEELKLGISIYVLARLDGAQLTVDMYELEEKRRKYSKTDTDSSAKDFKSRGYVQVALDEHMIWVPKSEAVFHKDKYYHRLEFCYEFLGVARVVREARVIWKECGVDFKKASKWEQVIRGLVNEALAAAQIRG